MAETLVENRVCGACGVDVRPGALFCYNCGGSVSPKVGFENYNKKDDVGESRLSEDVAVDSTNHNKVKLEELIIEKSVENNAAKPFETIDEKFAEKKSIQEQAKLTSAANLRRQSKNLQRKKVEIVWEEPEATPNLWFIIVAIVLTLFAAIIIYFALHLR